jgi:Ca2+-binding RTX toxin-like protein
VLTDFGHHLGQLNGNDVVIGGLGDDTLVGDDQSVVARTLTLDAAAMARTEALTRAMLDITDDFSDLVHAQYSQLGCDWWDDHHDWWDHDDDVVVDNVFTVGADSLDGGDGNDVLIGDDSILAETTFTLQVGYADDFERFAEGMADAGNEAADALLDLVYLDTRLRDQDVLVKHYTHWDHETVHHIDLVAMGNDTLNGGAGNDLMIGDAFTMRTAQANLVLGGTVPSYSDDDAWKNSDWCDDNHHHGWDHDHHDWNDDWHFGSVTSSADLITGGSGNDLAWGDSLAVQSTTITRGAGIPNSSYYDAADDAEDALCSLVTITDSADYWLALQDGGHCDNDYGDTINGGDGDDILFGQAGDDKLRGEAGSDWLVGGAGYNDCLDGGAGSDHTSNGNDSSSSLRSAVNSRLVNWKDSFKNYGVPFSPFGGLKTTKYGGCSDRDSFDFLTLDG